MKPLPCYRRATAEPNSFEFGTAVARRLEQALVTASSALDCNHSYNCWGCSSIIDPWGRIVAQASENDKVIFANIDLDYVDEVRQ